MKAVRAGIDTWSVAWRIADDSSAELALESLATVYTRRGRRLPQKVNGYTVGYFPAERLAFAEGHPFGRKELCPPNRLFAAFCALEADMSDMGLVFDPWRARRGRARRTQIRPGYVGSGVAGVRRLDLTADLAFDRGADGLAVLSGVSQLPMPRLQTGIRKQPGARAVETVSFYGTSGRRILARIYDKGIESGSAARGELVRPEDQRRFSGAARLPVEALRPEVCRTLFQRRFMPLWRATEGIIVGSLSRVVERVGELVEAGELTGAQAKSVVGRLALDAGGVEVQAYRTRARERALARRYGLILADAFEEVEVDLHAAIEAVLEAEDWYCEN